MRGEQTIFTLEIKKKSGLSINPDIHYSKVFSSVLIKQSEKLSEGPSSQENEQRNWVFATNSDFLISISL